MLIGILIPDMEQFINNGQRGVLHSLSCYEVIVGTIILTSFTYFLFHHFHADKKYVQIHHEHNLQYELFIFGLIVMWGLHLIFDQII